MVVRNPKIASSPIRSEGFSGDGFSGFGIPPDGRKIYWGILP
jgi:hypothetical protein